MLVQQIEDYEKQIQKILDSMPDGGIFRTLPGADYILGARLLVLYSIRDFASASPIFLGNLPIHKPFRFDNNHRFQKRL